MTTLQNKIDFAVIFTVKNANPNGDPLNGNRPRQNYEGLGEVSDVALKRKIRNRLQDMGECIFVQSDNNRKDECRSLKDRLTESKIKQENITKDATKKWFDVRAFGQVFPFKKKKKLNEGEDSNGEDNAVSIGIRGPVTIQSAFSVSQVDITSLQIVKSVNLETEKTPDKKASDTMGTKHRVDKGVYVTFGAINPQLAEKTGFSDEDAEKIKDALCSLFQNDASSARPEGSMEVKKVIWWKHNCAIGQYSSAKVHGSLHVNEDGTYELTKLNDLHSDELEGTIK